MQYNNFNYQEGKRTIKRISYMNFYQQLVSAIDELIECRAIRDSEGYHLQIDDLDEEEQCSLVALALEIDDRDTYECFNQPEKDAKDDDITCALIKMLKDISPDNCEDFAKEVRKQSIKRYRKYLNKMIDNQCYTFTREQESWDTYHTERHTGRVA